jgi:hypothetical protein
MRYRGNARRLATVTSDSPIENGSSVRAPWGSPPTNNLMPVSPRISRCAVHSALEPRSPCTRRQEWAFSMLTVLPVVIASTVCPSFPHIASPATLRYPSHLRDRPRARRRSPCGGEPTDAGGGAAHPRGGGAIPTISRVIPPTGHPAVEGRDRRSSPVRTISHVDVERVWVTLGATQGSSRRCACCLHRR